MIGIRRNRVAGSIAATIAVSAALCLSLASCATVPPRRVDVAIFGSSSADLREALGSGLGEVRVDSSTPEVEVERIAREVFPLAQARKGAGPPQSDNEYELWLREEEYSVGVDSYRAILCVLKLRSKSDGAALATSVISEDGRVGFKSAGYVYALVDEALGALFDEVARRESAEAKAASKAKVK